MYIIKSYVNSPAPAFDAVEHVKEYLGDDYDRIARIMIRVKDQKNFAGTCAMLLGIEGFAVKAWYNHFFGGNAWDDNLDIQPEIEVVEVTVVEL
jgi:hypothetical protein